MWVGDQFLWVDEKDMTPFSRVLYIKVTSNVIPMLGDGHAEWACDSI